ncbi:phospholipid/cholesterol/gamma-HCH transport system substrate-binding protein [Pseudoduganella lurida]|uniref:Phospholipid/cholesterol/gamma-HCH transport system substrate-binding protein n=1 Tax=Pseudoduganella lurida TaxID=1036180 RepID=A0A562RC45_9BURK|nr:MlaD family protein [Pseudoduganella lurida]TWI66608.1 phospholipid/cholesterol/gamma-HCH transport system substrate-binding protein [Pseudoduganella lurida]
MTETTETTAPAEPAPVRNAEFKAALLLILMVVLIAGAALYLMYARGAFEATQRLVLTADDSEGVAVGMDVTFAGFPIGRVRVIELSPEGKARVLVDVPKKDAHWLRTSSIFTLEKGIVGGAKLRAFTGIPTDPPLPEGAERGLLVGDAAGEIPKLLAAARDVLANVSALTAADSALGQSLQNVQGVTDKLNGPGGAMGLIAGEDKKSRELLANANSLIVRADKLVGNADAKVFGDKGVATDAQAAIVQLNGLLADARLSLKKMDAVLDEAQAVGKNARVATEDLGALRADVDTNLRKIEQLVNEINRKWPFKRDPEIKLP